MSITDTQSAKLSATIAENAAAEAKSYADLSAKSEDYSNQAKDSAASSADSASKASQAEQGAVSAADGINEKAQQVTMDADRAETAAENAQNIADANTYYTSTTDPDGTIAGLAGTVEGEGFRVAIPDGAGVIVIFNYYKKSGGIAQYINSEPSKRFVEILSENIEIVSKSNAQNMTGFPGGRNGNR